MLLNWWLYVWRKLRRSMIALTACADLIFFVFLCMPDSPTYHAHFVHKYLWDVNGIPSHVTSSSSLCAQWRVWSKNLPGGVSLTTSNRCRKICWQQAAWLSEGGNQHNRRRTTRASMRYGDQHCIRRVVNQGCLWDAVNKDCIKGEVTHTASGKAGDQLQWDSSCGATAVGKSTKYQAICVHSCLHCLDLKTFITNKSVAVHGAFKSSGCMYKC